MFPARTAVRRFTSLLVALAFAGCGSSMAGGPDGGDPGDAAESLDASEAPDAGDVVDAGDGPDAGEFPDAGDVPDAGDGPDAGPPPVPFAGDCTATFTPDPAQEWRHSSTPFLVTSQGGPAHRIRDVVLSPGEAAQLRGRFTYGPFDKDLDDEDVVLWIRRCPSWERLGTYTTDDDGIVHATLPTDLPKGEFDVKFQVLGDGTVADGIVAIWPQGTQAIVTDIDGTLTTSDWQAINDSVFGNDAEMYDDADAMVETWKSKGYRILYLTGRPQVMNRYSRSWLHRHAFARGPMMLTDDVENVMPTDSGVREFKGNRLVSIRSKGVTWRAAHGNATTDIDAYADASIPKADTYIIGPNAGANFTVAVTSYTALLPVIRAYPDATQP